MKWWVREADWKIFFEKKKKKKKSLPIAYPVIFNPVIVDSGNITVERAINIQSLRTPATRTVTAPVLPITKKMEKFRAKAHRALEKKIQKLNWICETSITGFSSMYQGTKRNAKLHLTKGKNVSNSNMNKN